MNTRECITGNEIKWLLCWTLSQCWPVSTGSYFSFRVWRKKKAETECPVVSQVQSFIHCVRVVQWTYVKRKPYTAGHSPSLFLTSSLTSKMQHSHFFYLWQHVLTSTTLHMAYLVKGVNTVTAFDSLYLFCGGGTYCYKMCGLTWCNYALVNFM